MHNDILIHAMQYVVFPCWVLLSNIWDGFLTQNKGTIPHDPLQDDKQPAGAVTPSTAALYAKEVSRKLLTAVGAAPHGLCNLQKDGTTKRKTTRLLDDTTCLELRFHAHARISSQGSQMIKWDAMGVLHIEVVLEMLETSQMNRQIDVSVWGYVKRQWQLWDVPLDWWSAVWLICTSGVHHDVDAVSQPEYMLLILHRICMYKVQSTHAHSTHDPILPILISYLIPIWPGCLLDTVWKYLTMFSIFQTHIHIKLYVFRTYLIMWSLSLFLRFH